MTAALVGLALLAGLADGEARLGLGVDGNALRDRAASQQAALLRVDLMTRLLPARGLDLSLSGVLEQDMGTTPATQVTEADLELLALYRRPLTERLELRVGSLTEFQRTRTLFVESLITQQGYLTLNEAGQHLLLGLRGRLSRFDLEGQAQGDYRWIGGDEGYQMGGMRAQVAARWFAADGVSLRLRYEYQLRYLNGLALLGQAGQATDVHVHASRVGAVAHLRHRLFEGTALYEYARLIDDRVGLFNGDEHRSQVSAAVELFGVWRLEGMGRLIYRDYPQRQPGPTMQTSDLQAEAVFDSRLWVWRRFLGVFARYQFTHVEAPPTDQSMSRHAAVVGVVGHLSTSPPNGPSSVAPSNPAR